MLKTACTVLSRASAHGQSELKCQKVRVGGYTEKVRKWSTIPVQGSTPDVKLAARVYCIVASSVLSQGQPDSGESCVMLQSWPTRSLVAKFSQCSVVTCSTHFSCCERGHGRVCVNIWCLMSWRPKCIRTTAAMWAHSGPTFGFTMW